MIVILLFPCNHHSDDKSLIFRLRKSLGLGFSWKIGAKYDCGIYRKKKQKKLHHDWQSSFSTFHIECFHCIITRQKTKQKYENIIFSWGTYEHASSQDDYDIKNYCHRTTTYFQSTLVWKLASTIFPSSVLIMWKGKSTSLSICENANSTAFFQNLPRHTQLNLFRWFYIYQGNFWCATVGGISWGLSWSIYNVSYF